MVGAQLRKPPGPVLRAIFAAAFFGTVDAAVMTPATAPKNAAAKTARTAKPTHRFS